MALIERINTMKQTGMSDPQIMTSLKEEGYSPMEISDALSQSMIKAAVSSDFNAGEMGVSEGMQPSIMSEPQQGYQDQQVGYQNQSQEQTPQYYPQNQYQQQAPMQTQQYYPQAQEQYDQTPQAYYDPNQAAYGYDQGAYAQPQGQEPYYQQAIDLETVRDIAKQETEEALKKLKDEISGLIKMKTEIKFEIQDMDNRLKRIESVINELQSAIVRKMGDYGNAIAGISKEIQSTQESFSKMVNPMLDKQRGVNPISKNTKSEQAGESKNPNSPRTESKSGESFEDYFR